ncbi:MAG: ATP-binding cassette domain-containing protein, partial [Eubacteriales bacterium]|nr:ATP-binding cassette domain-containing protein [Eubacteriales bacterium]
ALKQLDLSVDDGQFLTVIGGNGSGKSTLLNIVSGLYVPDAGNVLLDGEDITEMAEHRRARWIARVFQDPLLGTAAGMTIEENLALAARRGKRRTLAWGVRRDEKLVLRDEVARLGLGLEDRMGSKIGVLSGGQRQALTLLMAALERPRLLLLDEHTAALDPKTATAVLALTETIVEDYGLTTLMVTHSLPDAIKVGNRLIMMEEGEIVFEAQGEGKSGLSAGELLRLFHQAESLSA